MDTFYKTFSKIKQALVYFQGKKMDSGAGKSQYSTVTEEKEIRQDISRESRPWTVHRANYA